MSDKITFELDGRQVEASPEEFDLAGLQEDRNRHPASLLSARRRLPRRR